ncbi:MULTISPECIES: DEAD/DEAH box helicase [Stutzerimonas stutzeri subgroup]|uniref:DEAD/DEAH box helicase n=1 Tax=Stutzerimonas stutzeri subgroup TaxID=578833 RepID=UPI000C6D3EA0|nr:MULTISPECIES: DEAD/DEAH box helicase [Stutzerimonas stutzeri subgroup]MCQ2047506.1 DEAD/DEAH box helicase [Stutzerimonas kunmingensis]PKR29577.1 ATP-dependent DNA helicase [Stutzerimonas stutzeri]QQC12897.1 DEAD/DEAH box helicase [Stutzerimonas stutzeri]
MTTSSVDPLGSFHPAVAGWFSRSFPAPTPAQAAAWPLIRAGRSTLVAAPTGSGKTLTAFLAAIDGLVQQGLAEDGLADATRVLYVSPLKALSNDIHINLEEPLAGITAELARLGLPALEIRTAVRTGDTPQAERNAMRKRVPHILVTTPESLYVLLGSASGREMLADVQSVIVDEIHAIAGNKRGSHLALSLERLEALCNRPLVRVGLSATQKPIDAVARFLVGVERPCEIVDIGHGRARDLALEVPPVPLEAVMSNDAWALVYDRLAALAGEHRTTLVFVNTRRMAERTTRHLAERLGAAVVAAHHGSLAREQRLTAEQKLKRGELRVLVATASLELGIDIGDVELACQLGSPRSISAFLQRVGRAGHQVAGVSKGRLFPSSRDDLIECAALLDAVRRGELDTLNIPHAPLDVLAQQIVAEAACREWEEEALLQLFRRAMPYAALDDATFQALLRMLAEGYTIRHGTRGAYLHRDLATRSLRGRRGGRLTALTSGGTIADNADYAVLLEPQGLNIGTVNEDFAVESLAGDVFQLGNTSYRILKIESGRVRVEDAQGMPPSIPFWLGEAPGRSDELSFAVARLRDEIDRRLAEGAAVGRVDLSPAIDWLTGTLGLAETAARQIVEYLARARSALGALPTQQRLVMERFFDESGGTQLVIHSPYGSRINRAWGLALRKRFCRTFNFELQAAATEDAIILSLSTSHSFPLAEVWRYLHSASAEQVLIQALLDAPLFGVRWRWIATTALALPRMAGGRKVAPQLQRMKSDDLLATVFPDQVACLENIVGEREIPDHPLVRQTLDDCLHEAMDSEGWLALLRRMEGGEVELLARDLPAPSPLAMEILGARPYAFLDDAPLEERRTQAVLARRWSDPESADDLGTLDPEAIAAVRDEAWPEARSADELHEALTALGCIAEAETAAQPQWSEWLAELARGGRATRMEVAPDRVLWLPLERLMLLRAVYPQAPFQPHLEAPGGYDQPIEEEAALVELIRARLSGFGPLPVALIARPLALPASAVAAALVRLESQGYVMRGRFSAGAVEEEWCERHLLARIHRYTVKRLRREIEPVERVDFMRFLADWQHLSATTRMQGREALATVVEQLEGFQAAAAAWEADLLPARLKDYGGTWLDELCRSGRIVWTRLAGRLRASGGPVRGTPIVLLPRRQLPTWYALASDAPAPELSSRAQRVLECLNAQGALFFDELQHDAHLLRSELEDALGELVAVGLVNADSFAGLRALLAPASKRSRTARRSRGGAFIGGMDDAGRWALVRKSGAGEEARTPAFDAEALEHIARVLLRRYGVVCWRLLAREADWLPPWRDLLRVYHRLEARGEIRGGRFVAAVAGEQFALPEALGLLREVRKRPLTGEMLAVSAVDPFNQLGTLLPGARVPALAANRILFRDGLPVAVLAAGKPQWLVELDEDAQREARRLLTPARR